MSYPEYRGRIATGIKRPSKRVKFWQRVSDNAVAEETRMLADAADAADVNAGAISPPSVACPVGVRW